jgi:hypothetical protein
LIVIKDETDFPLVYVCTDHGLRGLRDGAA